MLYTVLKVSPTKETLLAWQNRPQKLVAKFIKQSLAKETNTERNVRNYSRLRHSSEKSLEERSTNHAKCMPESLSRSPLIPIRRQSSSRSESESSLAEIDSYEDEYKATKKFTGKGDRNRVRIDSMSQITGVRFDANPEHL